MILNLVPEGLEFPLKHTQSQYAKFWYMSWRSRVGIENKVYQLPVMGRIRWSTDWFKALAPSMVSVGQWWVWNTVLAYHPEVTLWQSRKQTSLVRWSRWTNTKIIGHGGLKFLRKVVLWTFFVVTWVAFVTFAVAAGNLSMAWILGFWSSNIRQVSPVSP